ncbi:MAG: hypothetical protein JNM66_23290, partial [Bryobacterales bacterium]|nr:hypothetical protein [Bryobacterales bacterium]
DAWAGTPVVFLGRVEKTEQRTFPYGAGDTYIAEQEARVVVEEAFKGVKAGERLALEQPGHNCAPKFKEGDRVLFCLHPTKAENVWEAYGCHRTRSLAEAADDLLFLRALPWAAARTRLSGEVLVTGTSSVSKHLAGIRVLIRSEEKLVETVTNGQGVYELYDLPAGDYRVEIQTPKGYRVWLPSVTGRRPRYDKSTEAVFALAAGQGVSASFYLQEDNAVEGRVVGPDRQPLRGVCVYAIPAGDRAGRNFRWFSCTKDGGIFRIDDIPAGSYRLMVNRESEVTGRAPYGRLYYPGVVELEKAEIIHVGVGEHRENLEFRIPKYERVVTVAGRVQFVDGQPAARVDIQLPGETHYSVTAADGSFRLPVVAGAGGPIKAMACLGNVASQELFLSAEKDETGIVLTLPVKACPVR